MVSHSELASRGRSSIEHVLNCSHSNWKFLVALFVMLQVPAAVTANDYFLVIGGGYSPQANQASLEANVLFFREVLNEQHHNSRVVTTFFADGLNEEADLQVLKRIGETRTPATDFLASVFSYRSNRAPVEYRNHRVPNIAGGLQPRNIESSLKGYAARMHPGDRLFVYVTSHGGSAKGDNKYNTTISCWNNQSISARKFESWLADVPREVPVFLVMAQCYCGGFAHAIFHEADKEAGLSDHLRVGFFAQQHDLAAAGCRPDIQNDEEYSSYFWGAIAGHSRTGKKIEHVDMDGDGAISFAEAHAYAVLASDTIDIPLRSTEALLRAYSKIGNYQHRREVDEKSIEEEESTSELATMTGALNQLAERGRLDQRTIVEALALQLEFQLDDDVSLVFESFAKQMAEDRGNRRGSFGRRRGRGSSRSVLLNEIAEHWPELGDRESWRESDLLNLDQQQTLFEELKKLPSYPAFEVEQARRRQAAEDAEQAELHRVRYQRLINTLEAIVLAENLPQLASEEVLQRYRTMLSLEESSLQGKPATARVSNL